jgi:hypothetical protein
MPTWVSVEGDEEDLLLELSLAIPTLRVKKTSITYFLADFSKIYSGFIADSSPPAIVACSEA